MNNVVYVILSHNLFAKVTIKFINIVIILSDIISCCSNFIPYNVVWKVIYFLFKICIFHTLYIRNARRTKIFSKMHLNDSFASLLVSLIRFTCVHLPVSLYTLYGYVSLPWPLRFLEGSWFRSIDRRFARSDRFYPKGSYERRQDSLSLMDSTNYVSAVLLYLIYSSIYKT